MQRMKDDTNDVEPNISDGGTLHVIYVCHLNVLACLFIMLSFKVSILLNLKQLQEPFSLEDGLRP
jgi:hypothetical protein